MYVYVYVYVRVRVCLKESFTFCARITREYEIITKLDFFFFRMRRR